LLAFARSRVPHLDPMLMTLEIFETHSFAHAVLEPVPARPTPPELLTIPEQELYNHLLGCKRGRLEQEFLLATTVAEAIEEWIRDT